MSPKLCDTFHLPMIYFADVPGFMIGIEAERSGLMRRGVRAMQAVHRATVPVVTIQMRRSYGLAGNATGAPNRLSVKFAWPLGEWGDMPIEGGVDALFRRELEASDDPQRLREEIEARMLAEASIWGTAASFGVEDIIDPRYTRRVLSRWDRRRHRRSSCRPQAWSAGAAMRGSSSSAPAWPVSTPRWTCSVPAQRSPSSRPGTGSAAGPDTVRDPFTAGQYADLGAELVDVGQDAMIELCGELGIELTPEFTLMSGEIVFDGRRLSRERCDEILEEFRRARRESPPAPWEPMSAWGNRVGLSTTASQFAIAGAGMIPMTSAREVRHPPLLRGAVGSPRLADPRWERPRVPHPGRGL